MDTNRTEQIIKFVDSQRVRIDIFGDNKSGERAYRRAERIVAAVFLLTNHVPDEESLKGKLRRLSLKAITDILKLRDGFRAAESPQGRELRALLKEMGSLVRLLAIAGYVSLANAEVLSDSIEDLNAFLLSAQRTPLSEGVRLSKELMSGVHDETGLLPATLRESASADVVRTAQPRSRTERPVTDGSGLRSTAVVSVLAGGVMMGIRDIVAQLPEYSEKMIQRELAALTDKGVVRKEGLKRWSRYALVLPRGTEVGE